MSNSLDPDKAQHYVRPYLSPSYLQRLSADVTSRQELINGDPPGDHRQNKIIYLNTGADVCGKIDCPIINFYAAIFFVLKMLSAYHLYFIYRGSYIGAHILLNLLNESENISQRV